MSKPANIVSVPVAFGELIDKITILEIKAERISDPRKLENIRTELDLLVSARDDHLGDRPELDRPTRELKSVNEALWEIEDNIRDCERESDFGMRFIALARSVYHTNDRRAELKREINLLAGSAITEEKSYRPYAAKEPR